MFDLIEDEDEMGWEKALFVGHNAQGGISLDIPKGMCPSLKSQQELVGGGYVQYFYTNNHSSNDNYLIICNEDGISKGLKINKYANTLFNDGFNVILGDVVIIPLG